MNLPYDRCLVIIPTYNEATNVATMIDVLFGLYPDLSVLIVDDGSPDGTAGIVKRAQQKFKNLHILERDKKLGLGSAYLLAFKWALERQYEFAFEMDCDFSHDPKQLQDLLTMAQTNDLVVGSRYKDGIRIINWPLRRLILSYCASLYTRFFTAIPIYDPTSGFKCFSRRALQNINSEKIISNGYAFQIEINFRIWSSGLKIAEAPIIFYERRAGQSKLGKGIVIEAIWSVIALRLRKIFGRL